MPRRIQTQLVNGTTVVTFVDRKLDKNDMAKIQELGDELYALVEQDGLTALVLDCQTVEFWSSSVLNKLIALDKKAKGKRGKVRLCNLKPEIQEMFVITRLNQLFDIRDTVADALAAFAS